MYKFDSYLFIFLRVSIKTVLELIVKIELQINFDNERLDFWLNNFLFTWFDLLSVRKDSFWNNEWIEKLSILVFFIIPHCHFSAATFIHTNAFREFFKFILNLLCLHSIILMLNWYLLSEWESFRNGKLFNNIFDFINDIQKLEGLYPFFKYARSNNCESFDFKGSIRNL